MSELRKYVTGLVIQLQGMGWKGGNRREGTKKTSIPRKVVSRLSAHCHKTDKAENLMQSLSCHPHNKGITVHTYHFCQSATDGETNCRSILS